MQTTKATEEAANVSDFFFEVHGVPAVPSKLIRFTGTERISQPYSFTIELEGTDPDFDLTSVLDKTATLTVHPGLFSSGDSRRFHGIVSSATLTGREGERIAFEMELVPRLWRLSLRRNQRIFQDINIPDAVKDVLKESGFTSDDYTMDVKSEDYPTRAYIVQYDESDLDFISRLLESQGISFCFEQRDSLDHLIITDNGKVASKSTTPTSQVRFRDPSAMVPSLEETVSDFELAQRMVTSKVSMRDFNFKFPSIVDAESQGQQGGTYEDYKYPGGFFVADHGDLLSERKQQQYDIARKTMRGKSDCRSLAAGYQFSLVDHYRHELDIEYTLVAVIHRGSDSSFIVGGSEGHYQNEFECIPADTVFRPPLRTPKPLIHGPQTAICTGPDGEKLFMDDLGRTKVKFHWDRSDTEHDHTSAFLRVSHPYAGRKHGIQFHPLIGDEVIVDFQDGDPDRPLITGRVYNADNMPPLKPGGRIQNVIYTPYQHRLMFDDKAAEITLNTGGGEVLNMADGAKGSGNNIRLSTADGHFMHLREDGPAGIEVKTKEANYTLYDDTNDIIETKTTGGQFVTMSDTNKPGIYAGTAGKHQFWLSDSAKTCGVQSTNEHEIVIDDNANAITLALKGGHLVHMAGDGGFIAINSKNKHAITIDDKKNTITLGGKSGKHTIQIQDDGDKILITAASGNIHINAQAGTLDLHGKDVMISADTKVTIKGKDIESSADLTHTTKGNSVMSSGTATNVVKGGMVHLNP